ncbi:MAG: cell wall hydrolase [Bradyrhizobium sp.]
MSVMRSRPGGASLASFGLALVIFALLPNGIGYQDVASLLARQPGVLERWQSRLFSVASSIDLATYSFSRPIGTSMPEGPTLLLASIESDDITHAAPRNPILRVPPRYQASDFPKVNRTLKGDRLVVPPPVPLVAKPADKGPAQKDRSTVSVHGSKTAALPAAAPAKLDPELQQALNAPPLPQYDISHPPEDLNAESGAVPIEPASNEGDGFSIKTASLYFGRSSLGGAFDNIEPWQPGEAPMIVNPDSPPISDQAVAATESGENVAPKGQVNASDQRKITPAQRLGLFDAKSLVRSERCLAQAVYFEARGEPVRGQIAVAQVVLNRVFSGYYPTTVCRVVYQNANRHLACQFTFACDGVPNVIREPAMWERARKIAKAMLDGLLWLPEVGKSTHYRAYWVHPSWISEMKRMDRLGVHIFYRPRAWGNGSDEPSWGNPQETAMISAQLVSESKSEAELDPHLVRR